VDPQHISGLLPPLSSHHCFCSKAQVHQVANIAQEAHVASLAHVGQVAEELRQLSVRRKLRLHRNKILILEIMFSDNSDR